MTNDYHFVTHWRVKGSAEEVYELISHPLDYPHWWPSVYLETTELEPGDGQGLGRRIRFLTRGWLPYTLRWESCAVDVQRPRRLEIRATGDFGGRGSWSLEQRGGVVEVTFDWKLTADKPLLRNLSFLLKPAFAANHRWAMARGQESLELELLRRRARTLEERGLIPGPRGPARTPALWLGLGVILLLGALGSVLRFLGR